MQWQDIQNTFSNALKNADLDVPDAVGKTQNTPSLKRFNVYRNNVVVSLTESLKAGFPVVAELVGDDFFGAMARVYIDQHLPKSPVLIHYGNKFSDFISKFEPAQKLPFLKDIARVEQAWTDAYNAKDETSISIDAIGQYEEHAIPNLEFVLHPSLSLIKSDFPALSIWNAHQQDNKEELLQNIENAPEHAVIVRPLLDVKVIMVLPEVFDFIFEIKHKKTISEAMEVLGEQANENLAGILKLLFDTGSVIQLKLRA